ncbi:MAG: TIGR01777 family oxidoreductase [Pseudomonadota bacterium]
MSILALEVLITLWDFVEEDMTRKLPATERVNHTLLALNYGAILALAAPYLWQWAYLPSALTPVDYGWWSAMAALTAIGVGVFSARDLAAASRSERLRRGDPARMVAELQPRQHVLVTGGTGFIGARLVQALVAAGHHVTVLTRDLRKVDGLAHPVRLIDDLALIHQDERFDAIVNLAGEDVASGLWTAAKRRRIIASRVDLTRAIDDLIVRLRSTLACLINGSAVGWYGLRDEDALSESAASAPAFTHEICAAWEPAAERIEMHGVRVVRLRIGLALGVDGGMLAKLLTVFEFGGGGAMGDGRQWMPWIEHDDMIRVIAFAIANANVQRPINAVAPNAVRNEEFTAALAAALHRPAVMRRPRWLIAGALGDLGRETMLGGQHAVPDALIRLGFRFRHEEIAPMLREITGAKFVATMRTRPAQQAVANNRAL